MVAITLDLYSYVTTTIQENTIGRSTPPAGLL